MIDEEDMSKRDKGTLFHKNVDMFSKTKTYQMALPQDVALWMSKAARYLLDELGPRCVSIQSEVAVGVNWVTGEAELFPDVKDRGYPERPGWQFGTSDLVCVLTTGELLIADWKTGGTEGATEQLLSLACGFRKCVPIQNVGRYAHTQSFRNVRILCLQVNDEGVWPHEQEVSTEQLESHWDSMRFQWEDIGKRNDPVTGIHCTTLYCPHLAYCPAISQMVVQQASGENEQVQGSPLVPASSLIRAMGKEVTVTDLEAGEQMAVLSAAKRQIKYAEEKLKEHVAAGGKVATGGYVWSSGNNGWRWRKQ